MLKSETYRAFGLIGLFLLAISLATNAHGQYPAFTNYSTEDGLSQSQVLSIHQDNRGFLWFGMLGGGLTRFDGTNFWSPSGDLFRVVRDIVEDTNGTLWFGTENGLFSYDGFVLKNVNAEIGLPVKHIYDLHIDKTNRLWIATNDGAFYSEEPLIEAKSVSSLLLGYSVRALQESASGAIWLGTTEGLYTIENQALHHVDALQGVTVNALVFDRSQTLWVASRSGVWSVNEQQTNHFTMADGLPGNRVETFLIDNNDVLWAATNAGAATWVNDTFQRYTSKVFDDDRILSLYQDDENNYWFGVGGKGVFLYTPSPFTYINQEHGLADNIAWTTTEVERGTYWIGTKRGLTLFKPPDHIEEIYPELFANQDIFDIHVDQSGRYWIAALSGIYLKEGNTFIRLETIPGMPALAREITEINGAVWFLAGTGAIRFKDGSYSIIPTDSLGGVPYEVALDKYGDLWFATDNGVTRYDETGFTRFSTDDGLSHRSVIGITSDQQGNLWLATYKGITNVVIDDQKTPSFHTVHPASPGDEIESVWFIGIDDEETLWFCNHNTVNRFSLADYHENSQPEIQTFDIIDGYYEKECTNSSLLIDTAGDLWFGTVTGISRHSSAAPTPPAPLRTYIEAIEVNNTPVPPPSQPDSLLAWSNLPRAISLKYNEDPLTFYFHGLYFKSQENVGFRYRLTGSKTTAYQTLTHSSVSFGKLWPGTYTLHVEALLKKGPYTSEAATYTFTIEPVYWQTWWFMLASLVGIAALIGGAVRWRTRQVIRQQVYLGELVQNRTRELEESNLALKKAQQEAQDAVKQKSAMLANMSHEIRTPMNGIIGATDLLLTETTDPIARDYLTMIQTSGDSLLTILNDILSYSKIEAGKVQLDIHEINIRSLTEDIATLFSPKAHQKGLNLYTICSPELPETLLGDSIRIKQILSNLVGNAIKFTETGEISIDVSCEKHDEPNYLIRFDVKDTGIGIPEHRLGAVFKSFEQANASTNRKFGGTGLGLAISQQLCLIMGGNIGVESIQGEGSTFWFTVPLKRSPGASPQKTDFGPFVKPTLLVDPSPTSQRMIKAMLAFCGCPFAAVASLSEAVLFWQSPEGTSYQEGLVMVDDQLFMTNSDEIVRFMSAIQKTPTLQLILLETSVSLIKNRIRTQYAFDHHLRKPVRHAQLLEVLLAYNLNPDDWLNTSDTTLPENVYIMGNNPIDLKLTGHILRQAGIRVRTERISANHFNLPPTSRPDLILLDADFPMSTAVGVIRSVRAYMNEQEVLAEIPLIGMIPSEHAEHVETFTEAGLTATINKPVTLTTLSSLC